MKSVIMLPHLPPIGVNGEDGSSVVNFIFNFKIKYCPIITAVKIQKNIFSLFFIIFLLKCSDLILARTK